MASGASGQVAQVFGTHWKFYQGKSLYSSDDPANGGRFSELV
jgi:hypothetical protein